jgi:hypothetical protein
MSRIEWEERKSDVGDGLLGGMKSVGIIGVITLFLFFGRYPFSPLVLLSCFAWDFCFHAPR